MSCLDTLPDISQHEISEWYLFFMEPIFSANITKFFLISASKVSFSDFLFFDTTVLFFAIYKTCAIGRHLTIIILMYIYKAPWQPISQAQVMQSYTTDNCWQASSGMLQRHVLHYIIGMKCIRYPCYFLVRAELYCRLYTISDTLL